MFKVPVFIFGILFITSCATSSKLTYSNEELDVKSYYDSAHVNGAFLMCDLSSANCQCYNRELVDSAFIPASTFKIVNSIIALETGVMKDISDTIGWDGVKRPVDSWNTDSDMKSAYRNSTVWFYQEIARRIGEEPMKNWLHKLKYGNESIAGGIDQFWLTGELRITPQEQMDFLFQLVNRKLPLSDRTYKMMEELMVFEQTDGYTIRAKTGWGDQKGEDVGWFIGYVTVDNKNYLFVNLLLNKDQNNQKFKSSRIEIALKILKEQKIITF
jgi:beta-lactamase class D